jgi:molecular chaperone DnaK (HSP70)
VTQSETFDPLIDELPSRYVVGVDLGTTNSAVTYIDTEESPWKIRVLSIPQFVAAGETESLETLPSFYFQPVQTGDAAAKAQLRMPWDKKSPSFCVGAYARDETARTSGRGIASAKSWLCHTAVDRTAALLPWQGAGDVKRLSPVDVSAQYLRHVRKAWDQQFPDELLADQDIVLTLPASFDEVARELTVEAASMAGLARVVLIEEPQAAFYAWVYKHDSDWDSRVQVGQKILVCDIGGGTTDFTLIRVRKSNEANDADGKQAQKIQFHRVAVGNHLILGGDNLDLAIAKYLEHKLTDGGNLESYQWDVLVGTSRRIKEQMLSDEGADTITVSLPSRGSKLIGGSLQTEATRDEIRRLIIDGFLPEVQLTDKPLRHASGFQEFGLPYASDPGITRYLAVFLTTHAGAGEAESIETKPDDAKPDVVLFNGGFFASPILRDTMIEQISKWFQSDNPDWSPQLLANDRLDLAVARGAAYYGIVRRDMGVRIAASLARSYYIGIGENDSGEEQAICIMPGNAEPGQTFTLDERQFLLTISEPVEFSIYVSSTRLADQPGQVIAVDPEQMTSLPPIRTVLRAKSRNEKRDVSVKLQVGLTEIGTIDLACVELATDRSWQLRFDIRATTQTDVDVHDAVGETQGYVDEQTWTECEQCIANVFSEDNASLATESNDPKDLVKQLSNILGMPREEWPMSFLRRVWDALIEFELAEVKKSGRAKSAKHEARWLNLLGYSLRPGYGVALDDWRVTETWRMVRGKLIHRAANIQTESLILWRRLGGGLSRGQQSALAEPLFASLRALEKQMAGKPMKGGAPPVRPDETVEVWRLLGSLELLPEDRKIQLGDMIVKLLNKPKLKNARHAMVWALGRLGQRVPLYGPLNTVVSIDVTQRWIRDLVSQKECDTMDHLAVVQMCRLTNDRYRDVDADTRSMAAKWLSNNEGAEHLIRLINEGGSFDAEQQGRIFGESLPHGLRMMV